MDNNQYTIYLIFALIGSAFAALYDYTFLYGLHSVYLAGLIGVTSLVWFGVNLAVLFAEGMEEEPDVTKAILPAWYILGFIIASFYWMYHVPSYSILTAGYHFGTWFVHLGIITAILELIGVNILLK